MPRTILHPNEKTSELSAGQRAADKFAAFVGSWFFIIMTLVIIAFWMTLNAVELLWQAWDPYPFILLNFVLSCMAAMQAPIILMSQNRANERDRRRAEFDYKINRKAEHEIENLQKELKSIKTLLNQRLPKSPKQE